MPVCPPLGLSAWAPFDDRGNRNLLDSLVNAPPLRHVTEFEKIGYGAGVDIAREAGLAERARGRRKGQLTVSEREVERLLTQPIANQVTPMRNIIPQHKGVHAAESGYQFVDTPFSKAVNEYFRIGASSKSMASALELGAQLTEIVDGTIEDDGDATILRAHGLPTSITEIENRQAAVAEHGLTPAFHAGSVRATVREGREHRLHCCLCILSGVTTDDASYSTHCRGLRRLIDTGASARTMMQRLGQSSAGRIAIAGTRIRRSSRMHCVTQREAQQWNEARSLLGGPAGTLRLAVRKGTNSATSACEAWHRRNTKPLVFPSRWGVRRHITVCSW